jgi:hypothetical protein
MKAEAVGGLILALLFFVVRIVAAIYCANKASSLNRSSGGWAVFGLFFPIISMIWISTLKQNINWHENNQK